MKSLAVITLLMLSQLSLRAQISASAAETISAQINTLASDHTDTMVVPTDGNEAVIVASTKVLSNKQILDLWIFVSGCAIGKYLNDNPSLRVKEIWFADVAGMKSKPMSYYSLPTDVAKSVQSRIHGGQLELKDGMNILAQKLSRKTQ